MGYDISTVPTVKVNGVTKTVGIKGVDSGKNFYWNKGDATITQDSSGTVLTTSDTLQVTYVGQFPTVIIAQDSGQVGAQASLDGTTGIVESVQQDATISTLDNGLSEAGQLLTRYATQGTQLQFTTQDSSFAQGQLVTVNMPWHGLNNAQMLVSDVSASDQYDGINIYYSLTLVLGAYDVSWVDFFSKALKQQTPPDSINVGVAQSVTLLASFSGGMDVSANLTVHSYSCPIPSPTHYPSEDLLPC
jgi:hypothetical protein